MFAYFKTLFKLNFFIIILFTQLHAHDEKRNSTPSSTQESIRNMSTIAVPKANIIDDISNMHKDAKITGELRLLSSSYNYERVKDTSDLGLGGFLKYEIFPYDNLNMAVALRTSKDIIHDNGELSSTSGEYTALTQAYINYNIQDITLQLGRQILNSPLANEDDKRMSPNTFEAYLATYEQNKFSFLVGHLRSWQGFSAGLDDGWVETGANGTNLMGIGYDGYLIDANLWFYNMNAEVNEGLANNSFYFDIRRHFHLSSTTKIAIATQYLKQKELKQSGISTEIYGLEASLNIDKLRIYTAYNQANKQNNKRSFEGFGGGTLFTNMDSMILDVITQDRASKSWATGLTYAKNDFDFLYAYAQFKGEKNGSGIKEFITEHNLALSYTCNKNSTISMIYANINNKENTLTNQGTWDNFRVLLSYAF